MSGSWWLPEAPNSRFSGVLSCSESGELRLKVAGHLAGERVGETERNVPTVIFGETYGDQGQAVTLRLCFKTNHTVCSNPLGNSQEFFAQRGYFGTHLSIPTEPVFKTATLSYSGLSSWMQNFSGLISGATLYSTNWIEPPTLSATIPGCVFELGARISQASTGRSRTLTESVILGCVFDPPVTEADFQSRVAYGFQGLLTFATSRPNAISRIRVGGPPAVPDGTRVIGPAVYTDETEASDLTNSDMLFSLGDIADRFNDVVRRWFALSDRYSKVLPLYFGGIYRPPGYTDLRFAQVLQALTSALGRRQRTGQRQSDD